MILLQPLFRYGFITDGPPCVLRGFGRVVVVGILGGFLV